MNYYGFPKFTQKSAKTKEKENRSCIGSPRVSKNHGTAHKHYSHEYWLRIWNPGLFHITTRGPFSSSLGTDNDGGPAPDRSRTRLEARRALAHAKEGVEHGDTAGGFLREARQAGAAAP